MKLQPAFGWHWQAPIIPWERPAKQPGPVLTPNVRITIVH